MITDMSDGVLEGQHQRARMIATGLLCGMAGLFVAALIWEPRYPLLGWLRSFSEAAMVGALADWYAVTALFRKPLGLPIPHTQIIPRNKDRIAARLGSLTQRQLLTPDAVGRLIESWHIPDEFTAVLLDPDRRQVLTKEATRLLARMLEVSEDAAMKQFTRHLAVNMLRGLRVAPLIGQLLSSFLQSAQRDRLVNDGLEFVHDAVKRHRVELCSLIADKLPWAHFLNLMRLDDKISGKLLDWFLALLADMRDHADDPARRQLIERLEAAARWLMHSEQAFQREDVLKTQVLTYDALLQFLEDSWHGVKEWLLADLQQDKSETGAYLDAALAGLGETLRTDREFVAMLQRGVQDFVVDLATRHRDRIGELVTGTVRDWSVVHMVDTIEREVGTDLQFIRINGAVVGGLVGLLLHAVSLLIGRL